MLNINSPSDTDDKFVFIEVQIMESIGSLLLFYNNTIHVPWQVLFAVPWGFVWVYFMVSWGFF